MFNLRNRGVRAQMEGKEREFYGRVRRFRVDPSASSAANPVPGEFEILFSYVKGRRTLFLSFGGSGRRTVC